MNRVIVLIACLLFCAGVSVAQKGSAEPDYYPVGYPGDTWTGEVTSIDNDRRTLTLTHHGQEGVDVRSFDSRRPLLVGPRRAQLSRG